MSARAHASCAQKADPCLLPTAAVRTFVPLASRGETRTLLVEARSASSETLAAKLAVDDEISCKTCVRSTLNGTTCYYFLHFVSKKLLHSILENDFQEFWENPFNTYKIRFISMQYESIQSTSYS